MKYFFVALLLLIWQNSNACLGGLDEDLVFKNPEIAKTILLLESIKEDKEESRIFLEAKKPWEKLKLQTSSRACIGLTEKVGVSYVFITSQSLHDIEKKKLLNSDGLLINLQDADDMKKHLPWLVKRGEIPENHPNVFWSYCQKSSECVQAKNSCGAPVGVNKKYQSNYTDYIKRNKFPKTCASKKESKSASKCIKNFCS